MTLRIYNIYLKLLKTNDTTYLQYLNKSFQINNVQNCEGPYCELLIKFLCEKVLWIIMFYFFLTLF